MREILTPFPDALLAAPRWWVALSGGADSVALLYALAAYRGAASAPPLHAIHVNHGLHTAAGEWADLCQRHADRLNIPLHINVCSIEPSGRGVEADARRERYRAFESVLAEGDILPSSRQGAFQPEKHDQERQHNAAAQCRFMGVYESGKLSHRRHR